MKHYFPFGQGLKKVIQQDRTPKKAFVLGVYASAVHARWIDKNGKQKVNALAVASEPEIFWKGENAQEIIERIQIPRELGKLTLPKNKNLNGPSGRILEEKYLKPLGLTREDVWLCDILPESRVNEKQRKALNVHYTHEIVEKFNLKPATVPDFDRKELNSEVRRHEILHELMDSKAQTIVLLGDLPIKYFLRFFVKGYLKLSDFGKDKQTYGKGRIISINGKVYNVIALCHPRQAGRLGSSNSKWGELHDNWINKPYVM